MLELARLASFLLFLGLGARLRGLHGSERRRAVQIFLAYTVALGLGAGLTQVDDWPFTSHTIAVGRPRSDSRICDTEFYGVDAAGREWRLDPYAWTPVYDSILQFWVEQRLPRLPAAQRARAQAFLLERAERSRARLAQGRSLGPERLLGRAGAPYWLLLPRHPQAPAAPFAALRAYAGCWIPAERLAGRSPASRTLSFEERAR